MANQNIAEFAGSALRQFYASSWGDARINAYSQFAKSCQEYADATGVSFLQASQEIHNMFINNGASK